jgi:hypothetical protein
LFEAYRAIERRMLIALGHDAETLMRRIEATLRKQNYEKALHDLRHLFRLDGGKLALSRLALNLAAMDNQQPRRGRAEGTESQEEATLDTVIRDEYGRRLVEFVVDNLSVEERYTGRLAAGLLLLQLKRSSADLADTLGK